MHSIKIIPMILLVSLVAFCGGGNGDDADDPAVSLFDRESENFFDVPFPSEAHRNADGRLDLEKFPNPKRSTWVQNLIDAVEQDAGGFGNNSAIYFRFSATLNTAALPDNPEMSAHLQSSVVLVNVDNRSDEFGKTIPFYTFYRKSEGFMWLPDTLVILPAQGFVLRPETLYCAVLTSDLKDSSGRAFGRDDGFTALIDDEPEGGGGYSDIEELHRTAMDTLADLGIQRDRIINMALFRTMDPTSEMRLVADKIYDEYTEPEVLSIALEEETEDFYVLEGQYGPNPVFQYGWSEGLFPYETEGGHFVFDDDGEPVVNGEETMMFALSVPRTPMPEPDGYPLLLYAHGTGGDYKSFVRNDTAERMAQFGIAVLGIDNSMNGTRIPEDASPETLFFNIDNIRAGRDNNRQGAADVLQLEKLAASLSVSSEDSPTGEEIQFNASEPLFMGHSQGGLNGSLYLALSRKCRGAYLSGSAGNLLYTFIYKTEPFNILVGIGLINGLSMSEIDSFDFGIYHPLLTLIQVFIETADPINYSPFWFDRVVEGIPVKHILMTEGMDDSFSPPLGIEALAIAGALDPINPLVADIQGYELQGMTPIDPPVRNNISTSEGKITAGLLQYPIDPDYDGHFVSYYNEDAIATWTWFLHTLAESGEPEIQ